MAIVRVTERGSFEKEIGKSLSDILICLCSPPAESGIGIINQFAAQVFYGAVLLFEPKWEEPRLLEAATPSAWLSQVRSPVLRLRRVDERVVKRSYGWLAYAGAPAVCLNY